MRLLIFICCISITAGLLGQQEIMFRQYNINDGLPQNSVTCMNNDAYGFLWIGTFDGLCRYDGYEFKTYHSDPNRKHSLRSNSIHTLYRDMEGSLWIGTLGGGLSRYDSNIDGFVYYELGLSKNNVRAIRQDPDSTFWIGTNNGLVHFDPVAGKKQIYSYESGNSNSPSDNAVNAIEIDPAGNIWIGTQKGGLNVLNRSSDRFIRIASGELNQDGERLKEINTLMFLDDQTLLIGTQNFGLLSFNILSGAFQRLVNQNHKPDIREDLNFVTVKALYPENDTLFWIGMLGGGLLRYDFPNRTFDASFHNNNLSSSLSRNAVSSVYKDFQDNLWVGTIDGGLNFSNMKQKEYEHFTNQPSNPGSLSHNSILSVLEDSEKNLWVGTDEGGLNVMFHPQADFRRFNSGSNDRFSTIHHVIRSLCEDRKGNIIIGTPSNGLSVYNRATKEFKHYNTSNSDLESDWIFAVMEDHSGEIWLGTNGGGLIHFDLETGSSLQYLFDIDDITTISNDYVTCLQETDSVNLWLGTWEGLNKFDREKNQFKRYFYTAENLNSLPNNEITCLHQDSRNNLWIGTYSGLCLYKPEIDGFISFTERDGLPNNVICSMEEDDEGNLWISTYKGLSKFSVSDTTFTNFNLGMGLHGNQFTVGASSHTSDGELLFGSINGLYKFDPNRLRVDSTRARVLLTDFKLFNKSVTIDSISPLKASIMRTTDITLNHHQHSFSIDFVAVNFNLSNQCSYRYILEGFDMEWIGDSPNRTAVYTNVPPGDYNFKVLASNSDGVWSQQPTMLSISIIPAFYQTALFRVGTVLLLVLLSASVPLLRYQSIKRQKNHLELVVNERTREVVHQKEELEQQAHTLKKANMDILHKNIELSYQKEEIENQSAHIEEMNRLLQMKADNLVAHLHEISEKRVMQKSVSFDEFREIYPDDQACYQLLRELKNPHPFDCQKCNSNEYYPSEGHYFRRCKSCGYREPLTNNTIFYRIKFPILKAFYILYLVSTGRELTIDDLSEVVILRRETCWSFRNKVMAVMKTRQRFKNPKEGWKELILIPRRQRPAKNQAD